ncbi:MAG: LamG domain-containing protein [Planctomycetes bacterium]|nr:LamG domain-containing protein [Planctomycetota bacterium]
MCKKLIYLFSFVLLCSVQTPGVANLDEHLVLHLPFDEGTGTVTGDRSQTGLQATLEGDYQWTVGMFGQAIEFTDGRAVISESNPLNLTQITVMAWINPTSVAAVDSVNWYTDINAIYGKAGSAGDDSVTLGLMAEDGVYFYTDTGANNELTVPDAGISIGQWHHIAGTFDGTVMRAFVDGEQVGELPVVGSIIENPVLPTIGGRADTSVSFDGAIDDVKVFDLPLVAEEIMKVMKGTEGFPFAWRPDPSDGALLTDTWANLSWSPGDFAVSHDVYIGDNFDVVDSGAEGTFQGNQIDTFIVVGFPGFPFPDGLVPGTTYYWRIDEVNDAEPNSPWKGDVWSFAVPPKTAYFPEPMDRAEAVDVDVQLSWTAGYGAKLHTPYFGETFDEVDNVTGGQTQGAMTYSPGPLKMAQTYYWRVDEFDIVETHKGNIWSFTTEGAVGSPNLAKGAVDVTQTPVLTWAPGLGASHEVYFGADAASLELKGSGNLGSESYEPGQLDWNTTYYWRVDEANNANADSPWTGPLWSFTTANFLIIDDMESYNDLDEADPASNRIYLAWIDGFDNPATNGSVVGNLNAPFAEQTIVNSGIQSMPMAYDNAVGKSEATLTLTSNKDWTVNGVDTLTIWYRGNAANSAETMYVMLNGSANVDNDNPDAALAAGWTEWNIPLQAFADQGVNLANVNSITLGLRSGTGGTGMLYFDDIRLYPPAP